jgi:hypothetical protein
MLVMNTLISALLTIMFIKWFEIGTLAFTLSQYVLQFIVSLFLFILFTVKQPANPFAHAFLVASIYWVASTILDYVVLTKSGAAFSPLTLLVPFLLLVIATLLGSIIGLKNQTQNSGVSNAI